MGVVKTSGKLHSGKEKIAMSKEGDSIKEPAYHHHHCQQEQYPLYNRRHNHYHRLLFACPTRYQNNIYVTFLLWFVLFETMQPFFYCGERGGGGAFCGFQSDGVFLGVSAVVTTPRSTTCVYPGRNNYAFKGTCNYISVARQLNTVRDIYPFDEVNAPDMLVTETNEAYTANAFHVSSVTPSVCMFSATGSSSGITVPVFGSATGVASYTIGGTGAPGDTATVATYRSVISTIKIHVDCCAAAQQGSVTCAPEVASLRVFDFVWELVPSLESYIDPTTSEPHYYEHITSAQNYSSALALCAGKTMFGLRGYVMVMDNSGEDAFISSKGFSGWLGISDAAVESQWKVVLGGGPKSGQNAPYTNWASGQPGNEDYAYHTTSGWFTEAQAPSPESISVTCEFGGTVNEHPTGRAFRGATRLTVRETECDYGPERSFWTFPGPCHTLHRAQRTETQYSQALFSIAIVPDIIPSSDTTANIKGFDLTVSPSLCTPITLTVYGVIVTTTNNVSNVVLSGTTTVSNYWNVMQTMRVTSCKHSSPSLDTYDILWQLVPDAVTFLMLPHNEPHYYWSSFSAGSPTLSWTSAATTSAGCVDRVLLGLAGYMATLTSEAEANTATNMGSSAWIGAAGTNALDWAWKTGPEAGRLVSFNSWANKWASGEPAETGNGVCEFNYGGLRQFHAADNLAGRHYYCEFGGTEGTYAFRGAFRYTVRTTACMLSETEGATFAFPGVCHVAFGAQNYEETTTRAIFDEATVPDLIASDAVYSAKAFKVWSNLALCGDAFTVHVLGNVHKKVGFPTSTVLELEGVDSVANYHSTIRTITATSCARFADVIDEYVFQWYLSPEGVVVFNDPATNEPHYYQHMTDLAIVSVALNVCRSKYLFGLRGYLVTVSSQSEGDFMMVNTLQGILGAEVAWSNSRTFYWINGPEAGMTINNFAPFDIGLSQPSFDFATMYIWMWGPGNIRGHGGTTAGAWDDMDGAADLQYTCEFGGTQGSRAFRGATRLDIRSSVCQYGETAKWADKGPCQISHLTIGHHHTTSSRRGLKLFSQEILQEILTSENSHHDVEYYGVSVSAATPMCDKFSVDLPPGGAKVTDTTSQLMVRHALSPRPSVSAAKAALASMSVFPCSRGFDSITDYHFQWEMVPAVLATFVNVATLEPRYLWVSSGVAAKKTWDAARAACETLRPFGMVSYLATIDDANAFNAVSTLIATMPDDGGVWIGLWNRGSGFQWEGGPVAGTFLSPNASHWSTTSGEPNHCVGCDAISDVDGCTEASPLASGKWYDRPCSTTRNYVCMAGGVGGTDVYRGMILARVHSTACHGMGGTEAFGFKGTCHTLPELHQAVGATITRSLFSADDVPDLISDSETRPVKSFELSVSPPLCTPFTVTYLDPSSFSLPFNTVRALSIFKGTQQTVAAFRGVVQTITITSCARSANIVDTFTFIWEFMPDLEAHSTLSGERHYYELFRTSATWLNAVKSCATKTAFGLTGYLATFPDEGSFQAISTFLRFNNPGVNEVVLGAAISRQWIEWHIPVGPRTGNRMHFLPWWSGEPSNNNYAEFYAAYWYGGLNDVEGVSTYSNWNTAEGEPTKGAGEDYVVLVAASGKMWNDVTAPTTVANNICEFGGTALTSKGPAIAFRGETKVKVHTSGCNWGTMSDYTYRGTCRTLDDVAQVVGTTTTRSLFTDDAVPDLIVDDPKHRARNFVLSVEPPMCTPLDVSTSDDIFVEYNELLVLVADYDSPWTARASLGSMMAQYLVLVVELVVRVVAMYFEVQLLKKHPDIKRLVHEETRQVIERPDWEPPTTAAVDLTPPLRPSQSPRRRRATDQPRPNPPSWLRNYRMLQDNGNCNNSNSSGGGLSPLAVPMMDIELLDMTTHRHQSHRPPAGLYVPPQLHQPSSHRQDEQGEWVDVHPTSNKSLTTDLAP